MLANFPSSLEKIEGNRLVYLDNSATTQKPRRVIDALSDFYENHNANVHRGIHTLSNEASEMYEHSHEVVAEFINAESLEEIVFTSNATASMNLLAYSWGRKFLKKGDVVVVTEMEHHSDVVPWQMICESDGVELAWIEVGDDGQLDMKSFDRILKKYKGKIKLVSIAHISNVLGTINPIKEICERTHKAGALCHIDSAQSAARQYIDVKDLDIDFLSFSSHKMYGPDGIGVFYGKKKLLEEMDPWMGGGGMIRGVSKEKYGCAELPWKFEAGTPNISDGVVFAEAIAFIQELGMDNIIEHEHDLMAYAIKKLKEVEGVKIIGPMDPAKRLGALSFVVDEVHPHDLASIMNEYGVAIRAGHHCAMPLHTKYGIQATSRMSFGVYNTKEDIDVAVEAIKEAREEFMKA